jgi:putative addiction module component (TIGR02574 family)
MLDWEPSMSTYEEIKNAALALPPDARATLAEDLLDSLTADEQRRIDSMWAEEAERRDEEIENGIVTAIPGEEVLNRLRSRY